MTQIDLKPSRANMLWNSQVLEIGRQIFPGLTVNGIGDLPKAFYNNMGQLIGSALPDELVKWHNPTQWQVNFGRSRGFSADSLAYAVYETARWPNFNTALAKDWLGTSLPRLLTLTSLNSKENNFTAAAFAIHSLSEQVGQKNIRLLLPLCPSYDYTLNPNGFYQHRSGKILDYIGPRFQQEWQVIQQIFAPLAPHGVRVDWNFLIYSGQSGRQDYLTDLGKDVLEYYSLREKELFTELQIAFTHLASLTGTQPLSMDLLFGGLINGKVGEFLNTFPSSTHTQEFLSLMSLWLTENWRIPAGWLIHYIRQELKYRKTQEDLIQTQNDLIPSALREGLLYQSVINFANQNSLVILDLETDPLYMMGELQFSTAPCLIMQGYNRQNPNNPLAVRQPYSI